VPVAGARIGRKELAMEPERLNAVVNTLEDLEHRSAELRRYL
jgi:hypothetical protein